MMCFTTRHIQGGMSAAFFNSEGAKINDLLGPPGVRPPGYTPALRDLQTHTHTHKYLCHNNHVTQRT